MLSLIFALLANIAPASQACETFAPNLDGIAVTVCEGAVVSRTDQLGVTHYVFNDSIDAF
jgi:hypothetical protein